MPEPLKPCECGSDPRIHEIEFSNPYRLHWTISCDDCGASAGDGFPQQYEDDASDAIEQAVEAWSRRSPSVNNGGE